MNEVFLFLIAIPLGVYLVLLLFQTFEIGASKATEQKVTHEIAIDSVADEIQHDTVSVVAIETIAPETNQSVPEIVAPVAIESAPAIESDSTFTETASPALAAAAASAIIAELTAEKDSSEMEASSESHAQATVIETEVSEGEAPRQESIVEIEHSIAEAPTQEAVIENGQSPAETIASALDAPEIESLENDQPEPILPEGPLELPEKGSPKFAFDYRGRLWIEKRNKGFFRQLRRPQLPPDEPPDKSSR